MGVLILVVVVGLSRAMSLLLSRRRSPSLLPVASLFYVVVMAAAVARSFLPPLLYVAYNSLPYFSEINK